MFRLGRRLTKALYAGLALVAIVLDPVAAADGFTVVRIADAPNVNEPGVNVYTENPRTGVREFHLGPVVQEVGDHLCNRPQENQDLIRTQGLQLPLSGKDYVRMPGGKCADGTYESSRSKEEVLTDAKLLQKQLGTFSQAKQSQAEVEQEPEIAITLGFAGPTNRGLTAG